MGLNPALFNAADALDYKLVVAPVRPTMERHSGAVSGLLGSRKKQTVGTKIVKPDGHAAKLVKQRAKTATASSWRGKR